MKLTVKNFGPIREARDIDIGPMTIFVGPSNTGKSYLAMLVYSFYKALADRDSVWELSHQFRRVYRISDNAFNNVRKSAIEPVQTETDYYQWARVISDMWKRQLLYCFGEEGKNVLAEENGNDGCSVVISDDKAQLTIDLLAPENSKITSRAGKQIAEQVKQHLLSGNEEHFKGETLDEAQQEFHESLLHRYYLETISDSFRELLLFGRQQEGWIEAFYLPATRGGIMQNHRTLVTTVMKGAPMAGLSDTPPIRPFNGVISDFMTKLINIDGTAPVRPGVLGKRPLFGLGTIRQRNGRIEQLGKSMERRILSGDIEIEMSETGYPDFRYKFRENGKEYDLPLMSASSSVSELAPVSLFIRHYVYSGDLFILEEPEAHLHPGAQRKISGILARLANDDVNVLITTHSGYILEQITNFIYAADLPDSKLTKLAAEKCAVYLFKPGRKGSKTIVKKIPFDPEVGLLTEDHLDVSSDLYNETVNLMEQRENAGN